MKKPKNKIILEFSEFNALRFNQDSSPVSVGTTVDSSTSVNAFDRYENMIRQSTSKINSILQSLGNSSAYRDLKDRLAFSDQKPLSIKINRIIPQGVNYYAYISFKIKDVEYDGVVKDLLNRTPQFTSNVFSDNELIQSMEWAIRLKGLIINTIKKWIIIEPGKYSLLNDSVDCFNIYKGNIKTLKKGSIIEVIKTIPNENRIIIKINNQPHNLINDAYIYFNYWFVKE